MGVLLTFFKMIIEYGPLKWGTLATTVIQFLIPVLLGPHDPAACSLWVARGSYPILGASALTHPCFNALGDMALHLDLWPYHLAAMLPFVALSIYYWHREQAKSA